MIQLFIHVIDMHQSTGILLELEIPGFLPSLRNICVVHVLIDERLSYMPMRADSNGETSNRPHYQRLTVVYL